MENKFTSAVINFFIRAIVGMALIFFINQFVLPLILQLMWV